MKERKINKKAQLKIQEMAFVLVAVVVLLALGMLFFVSFQSKEMAKNAASYREARAITLVEVIASLPELRCSSSFSGTSESVCLDYDKVNFFSKNQDMQNRYASFWQNNYVTKIEIEEAYVNWVAPRGNTYVIYDSKELQDNTKTYATYAVLCLDQTSGMMCRIVRIKTTIVLPEEA